MDGRLRYAVDLLEGRERGLEVGPQIQCVAQVQRGLLVVAVRLKDLAQSEVLLPGAAVRRLHLQRAARQVDGVVQVLQRE